jgi:hypothetical protein
MATRPFESMPSSSGNLGSRLGRLAEGVQIPQDRMWMKKWTEKILATNLVPDSGIAELGKFINSLPKEEAPEIGKELLMLLETRAHGLIETDADRLDFLRDCMAAAKANHQPVPGKNPN